MKIYTDSWHYRFIAKHWIDYPNTLCWCFWKVVLCMVLWLITALFVAAMVISIVGYPVWQIWMYDPVLMVLSILAWLVIGWVLLYVARQRAYETGRVSKPEPKPYKEPGLVRQYVRAAHRKVCPVLDYRHRRR